MPRHTHDDEPEATHEAEAPTPEAVQAPAPIGIDKVLKDADDKVRQQLGGEPGNGIKILLGVAAAQLGIHDL